MKSGHRFERGTKSAISGVEASIITVVFILAVSVAFYLGTISSPPPQVSAANPAQITISGTFGTITFGTSASSIRFENTATGISYPANVSGNSYTIMLANQATYVVSEHWSSMVNSGNCSAGTLPLYLNNISRLTSIHWSC